MCCALRPLTPWPVRDNKPLFFSLIKKYLIFSASFLGFLFWFAGDRFFWFSDEEFARQTLAGLNPLCIKLITVCHICVYIHMDPELSLKFCFNISTGMAIEKHTGPSSVWPPWIKNHHRNHWASNQRLHDYWRGTKNKQTKLHKFPFLLNELAQDWLIILQAIKQKKLFILDYHDLMLPYVKKVRTQENTTLYGSRTVFFLTPGGTLRPLAIELVRPPMDGKPQWKEVYTPCWYSTGCWLWRLAKAQVVAIDSGYHQLVSHW